MLILNVLWLPTFSNETTVTLKPIEGGGLVSLAVFINLIWLEY